MLRTRPKRKQQPRRYESERRDNRKKKRASTPRFTANAARLLCLGALVVFTVAIWLLLATDLFVVHHVTVAGNRRVSSQHVVELSGIAGHNIFSINTTQARRAVLDGTPLIKDVYLDYQLPADVAIRVEERSSFAAWKIGDATYDVSREGMILGAWDPAVPLGLVVVAEGQPLSPGDTLDPRVLEKASRLKQELLAKTGVDPTTIRYSEPRGLAITATGGLEVVFGSGDDLDGELAALQSVLEESRAKNLTPQFVDVSFKNRPYFR